MTVVMSSSDQLDATGYGLSSSLPPAAQQTLGAFADLIRNALTAPGVDLLTITAREIANSLVLQGIPKSFIADEYPNECFLTIKQVYQHLRNEVLDRSVTLESEVALSPARSSVMPPEASASPTASQLPGSSAVLPESSLISAVAVTDLVSSHRDGVDVQLCSERDQPVTSIDFTTQPTAVQPPEVEPPALACASRTAHADGTVDSPIRNLSKKIDSYTPASRVLRRSRRQPLRHGVSPEIMARSKHVVSRATTRSASSRKSSPGVQTTAEASSSRTSAAGLLVKPVQKDAIFLPTHTLPKLVITSSSLAAVRQRAMTGSQTKTEGNVTGSEEEVEVDTASSAKRVAADSDDEEDEFAASFIRKRRFVF